MVRQNCTVLRCTNFSILARFWPLDAGSWNQFNPHRRSKPGSRREGGAQEAEPSRSFSNQSWSVLKWTRRERCEKWKMRAFVIVFCWFYNRWPDPGEGATPVDMKHPLHQRCLHEHRCMKTIYIMHAIGINVRISRFISVEKNWHVEKFQIPVKNLNNLWSFIEIYAVFVLHLCGEKSVWRESVWRKSLWRKNDKYEVCICM